MKITRYLYISLFATLAALPAHAQVKPDYSLELAKSEDIQAIVPLGERGILVQTLIGRKRDKPRLIMFDNKMNQAWQYAYGVAESAEPKEKKKKATAEGSVFRRVIENILVASGESPYAYILNNKNEENMWNRVSVTRVDSTGQGTAFTVTFDLKNEYILEMFAMPDGLYFLAEQPNKEDEEENKAVLYRLAHTGTTLKRIETGITYLRSTQVNLNQRHVQLLGTHDGFIYLSWKQLGIKEEVVVKDGKANTIRVIDFARATYRFMVIDEEGEVYKDQMLDVEAGGDVLPLFNLNNLKGTFSIASFYNQKGSVADRRCGTVGGIYSDPVNESIYIYGLYGKRSLDPTIPIYVNYDGMKYFIMVYNEDGKLLEEYTDDFIRSGTVLTSDDYEDAVKFTALPNNILRFQYAEGDEVYTLELDAKTKKEKMWSDNAVYGDDRNIDYWYGQAWNNELIERKSNIADLLAAANASSQVKQLIVSNKEIRTSKYSIGAIQFDGKVLVYKDMSYTSKPAVEFFLIK